MGRALLSATYGIKAPAVVEPVEPIFPDYGKWSTHNPFDPDSDEFFADAENEFFVERGEIDRHEHPVESSSSGSDTEGSPVPHDDRRTIRMSAIWDRLVEESAAVPAPADDAMLADIPGYARTTYPRRAPDANAGSDVVMIHADPAARPRAVTVSISSSPPLHPPSALRNSTTATDLERASSASSPAPAPVPVLTTPRRISVPPISIPTAPSTPSPSSPSSPSTPPALYAPHLQLMTPSPPPTVSPRIYTWGGIRGPVYARRGVAFSPGSPSVSVRHAHTHAPASPLTARITSARMRV
ncbi:hypothetical protein C8F04DRAFT_1073121 [Mycena alexandri]|uniref:Uncharacterized protein n=1 Tax=Mycena alexandri TaxID=1745969 RepID=A0AAD6XFW4_9AGAR|nr:hypothetical protein C8F04DRAFT_1073121 [Mycena alexandri]